MSCSTCSGEVLASSSTAEPVTEYYGGDEPQGCGDMFDWLRGNICQKCFALWLLLLLLALLLFTRKR